MTGSGTPSDVDVPRIVNTEGVLGGDPRIDGTRIGVFPVYQRYVVGDEDPNAIASGSTFRPPKSTPRWCTPFRTAKRSVPSRSASRISLVAASHRTTSSSDIGTYDRSWNNNEPVFRD